MGKPLIVVLSLCCLILFASCGVGPVVKILKSYNDESARQWITFIQKNGINAITEDGQTILIAAISGENVELVKACLKCKADVNISSEYSKFPISLATHYNKNLEIADMLLSAGANTQPREGEDALQYAIEDENVDMINLLVKHKVPMDYSKQQTRVVSSVTPYAILKPLIEGGFKPSVFDLRMIIPQYIDTQDETVEGDYLNWISTFAKDPAYKDTYIDDKTTLLTGLYEHSYSTPKQIEKGMNVITQLVANGHTACIQGAKSPTIFIASSRIAEDPTTIVNFFLQNGLELNTLSQGQYFKTTVLHEVILNTGNTETYGNAVALYNYLVSIGADPSIRDEEDNSATQRFEDEKTRYTQHQDSIRRAIIQYKRELDNYSSEDIISSLNNPGYLQRIDATQIAAFKEILHDRGVAGY